MTTSRYSDPDLFGHGHVEPTEQERLWAEQRTACWHNWLWTLFVWANIEDVLTKKRLYREHWEKHGEIATRSLGQAVAKVKAAAYRMKVDLAPLQYAPYADMEKAFRRLMRGR